MSNEVARKKTRGVVAATAYGRGRVEGRKIWCCVDSQQAKKRSFELFCSAIPPRREGGEKRAFLGEGGHLNRVAHVLAKREI